jgi:hypothetical protein
VAVTADTAPLCLSVDVEKGGHVGQEVRVQIKGAYVLLDPNDGTYTSTGATGAWVRDAGEAWRVSIATVNDSSSTAPAYVWPAHEDAAATGAVRLRRAHVSRTAHPVSHVPTYGAPATRAADACSFPFPSAYQPFWVLAEIEETSPHVASGTADILRIGADPTAVPYARVLSHNVGKYQAILHNGSASAAVTVGATTPEPGDVTRLLLSHAAGTLSLTQRTDGDAETSGTNALAAPATWSDGRVHLSLERGARWRRLDVYSSAVTMDEADRGDLFSFRPSEGDTVEGLGGTFTRASPATYTAKDPAPLTAGPDAAGWIFADPGEAYPGGRVPLRDHLGNVVGTVVQGVDDAVGTSDPVLTRAGWVCGSSGRVHAVLSGTLDVVRSVSDLALALSTVDGSFVLARDAGDTGKYVGLSVGADNVGQSGAGAPSYAVDGAAVVTKAEIQAAVARGVPVYAEVRGADLTAWTGPGYNVSGTIQGTLHAFALRLSGTAASAQSRAAAHAHVRAMCARRGVTLPDLP